MDIWIALYKIEKERDRIMKKMIATSRVPPQVIVSMCKSVAASDGFFFKYNEQTFGVMKEADRRIAARRFRKVARAEARRLGIPLHMLSSKGHMTSHGMLRGKLVQLHAMRGTMDVLKGRSNAGK